MKLRQHQRDLLDVCENILGGAPIKTILVSVTPGGGKSLLPQILAHKLIPAIADRLCWIVPRLALQDQGARGFNDPANRQLVGHQLEAMASTNITNPTRGCSSYVTTYQALGVDKAKLNAKEFKKHRYILVLDENHHVEESGLWHEALQPLVDRAVLVVLMSGTFERGDGNPIAFVPYDEQPDGFAIDFRETASQAVIRYGLRDAWAEQAVIDLDVHYIDCSARWKNQYGVEQSVASLSKADDHTSIALYAALHSEAAIELLELGVDGWEKTKISNPRAKLLVVAATIEQAKRYTDWFQERRLPVEIATSDDSDAAHQSIKKFKRTGRSGLDILITVAMAYEGLDVPAITHLICLTHIRTRPWIEQVVHRATRVDHAAGPYHTQRAHIFAPDDAPFQSCMNFLFAERDKFRACAPEVLAPENPMPAMEPLCPGQGLYPNITILGSSVVGVRKDALLDSIRQGLMDSSSFAEIQEPQTPVDRCKRLRQEIERTCRRHERKNGLPHGTVNLALMKTFKLSRKDMTEALLEEVKAHAEKKYG